MLNYPKIAMNNWLDLKIEFKIEQVINKDYYLTKITNSTPYDCFIQIPPKYPKRKVVDFYLIKNETYLFIDNSPIDLTEIRIIFKRTRTND